MKKLVKLSGRDVTNIVDQIVVESKRLKAQSVNEETTYGKGMADQFHNDHSDTKWHVGRGNPTNYDKDLRNQDFDQYVETFGPITVKIVNGQKVACIGGKCYDANDMPVVESKNPSRRKRTIRLTESEMIEFLDKLATRVENSRRRRGLK